jgi:serine protease
MLRSMKSLRAGAVAVAVLGALAGGLSSAPTTAAQSAPIGIHRFLGIVGKQSQRRSSQLTYYGGLGGVGVQTSPRVYLVFWGSQWTGNDPSGEMTTLQDFLRGVGGSSWENTVTQYCQGVHLGATYCSRHDPAAGNPLDQLAGVWLDNSGPAPSKPVSGDAEAEAAAAAAHFGNTTPGSNTSAQYVIAMSPGNNPTGFGSVFCAWHGYASSTYGNLAYTGLPYITDGGTNCGADWNGLGPNAGITIVEGHELAETITDPYPDTGWLDSHGAELGDKCTFIPTGTQGAAQNITLSTGTFPVQSLYSNAFNKNTGGCVISYP